MKVIYDIPRDRRSDDDWPQAMSLATTMIGWSAEKSVGYLASKSWSVTMPLTRNTWFDSKSAALLLQNQRQMDGTTKNLATDRSCGLVQISQLFPRQMEFTHATSLLEDCASRLPYKGHGDYKVTHRSRTSNRGPWPTLTIMRCWSWSHCLGSST